MGDLFIAWKDSAASVTNYQRYLNLETAVAVTKFHRNGALFIEEVFTDFVNDITWVRLSSSKKKSISVSISLYRKENANLRIENNTIIMQGQLPSGKDKGMQFVTIAQPAIKDGSIRQHGNQLLIENTTECWIKISSATNYYHPTGGLADIGVYEEAFYYLDKTKNLSFNTALQKSTAAYQKLFNRCRWFIPDNKMAASTNTNQRLINYSKGNEDVQLPVLYFNLVKPFS